MSSGTMQAPAIEQAEAAEQAQATGQPSAVGQTEQPPPMTAEAARRLAAILAPHLMAMRAVTAGTRYGACAGADATAGDPAARDCAATSAAAGAQLPPASAATRIFIAGMLERLSA
jgi:hypothetical protein